MEFDVVPFRNISKFFEIIRKIGTEKFRKFRKKILLFHTIFKIAIY
jgi:hypothetical protein